MPPSPSHVLDFDDCPEDIRLLILECHERLLEAFADAESRLAVNRRQVDSGGLPSPLALEPLAKVERYRTRIEILELLYYDRKFGFQKAREPLR